MIARFADTSFYVALGNPKDSLHQKASQLAKDFHGLIVTTDFVVVEVGNFFSFSGDRRSFEALLKFFRDDSHTMTIPASRAWLERGISTYSARPDKNWSLTDCISFAVMQDSGLTEALTGDHHFEQAGFVALLV